VLSKHISDTIIVLHMLYGDSIFSIQIFTLHIVIGHLRSKILARKEQPNTTAEGMGGTEADDIRIAITRAMETIFNN